MLIEQILIEVAIVLVVGAAVLVVCTPSMMLRFMAWLLWPFIRVRVFGRENLPRSGPVLLVSNHISVIDMLLIQSLSHRRIRFMVRAEILDFLPTRFIFWYLGVLRVPSAHHPKKMKQFFADVRSRLRRGEILCFFPEGAISGNGNLMRFRSGVEPLIPRSVEVTILPMRIGMLHGRLFAMRNGRIRFNLPSSLPIDFSVTVGEPVIPELSAFALRQKISELGAIAERRPQPGELPCHSSFLLRAKRRPWQVTFVDAATDNRVGNFNMLVRAVLLSARVRELDRGESGYVGLLLPNSTAAAAAMLGILYADRTPAVVNFSAGQDVALGSARRAGVRTILTSRKFLEKLGWSVAPEMICLEDVAAGISRFARILCALKVALVPRRMLLRMVAPLSYCNMHHEAVLLFSSGSTGTPKAVMLTHRNINCDIWSFLRMIAIRKSDRVAGNLPLFHAYGFTVQFAFPAQVGILVAYVMNPLASQEVIKSISDYKLTVLTATPTFLQKYLHRADPEDLSSLRLVIAGAEKLRPELANKYREMTGREVIEGYGCTELSPIVTVNFNNSIFDQGTRSDHPGSIGCPLPGIHVRIVDPETGVELGPGLPGRMQVKSGTVMKGYLNDREQTERVIQNGYYDTGDIAKFDIDGYVYITGRASRFSKIGGEMVPHQAIEDEIALFRNREEREVAVTGRSDGRRGERLVVFYTPEDFPVAEVIEALRERKLPNLWIPKADDFIHVRELPLLGSGKLDLRRLKEMAEEL